MDQDRLLRRLCEEGYKWSEAETIMKALGIAQRDQLKELRSDPAECGAICAGVGRQRPVKTGKERSSICDSGEG